MQTRSMRKAVEKSPFISGDPPPVKKKTLADIKKSFGIDDNLTKVRNKKKKFSKMAGNVPQYEHYNYMADTMFMPTDAFGFKYILVVTDLANHEFDMEPMKHKDADAIMSAMNKIFKREYLDKPEFSIVTDAGTEFQGIFKKWMYDESIYHKVTLPGRHKQLANIDNLINQLNSLFNGLMNKVEMKTGKVSKSWTKHVPQIREMLNEIRKTELNPDQVYDLPETISSDGKEIKPKFKVGDSVHVLLDRPQNARGETQTGKFRTGDNRYDIKVRKIKQVLTYAGDVLHRYMVSGIKNVSYTDGELLKA
jgi:hypothetical protein